ncbi:uncharacterized protein LOC128552434 [Mercenaria mercenaria]|uniref:uncharacterized protein LOC128552434 n=1 Tax=Mercenaria mercenaria TaxID=6596 RepID=UPI00234E6C6D|nr:uncharacterized protein LOC128552434 [Mercenaria mercenaria]XP_053389449.1 uncharacterized protein LOC128552434 [Mercenaria mercenaria]
MKDMLPEIDIKRLGADDYREEVIPTRRTNGFLRSIFGSDQMLFWEIPAAKMYVTEGTYVLADTTFKTDPVCFLYKNRLTESDMRLLTYLHQLCQNLIIVRTCIDEDVRNYERSHPQTHKEIDILSIMQSYMHWHKRILEQSGKSGNKIYTFLVSNIKRRQYDQIALRDLLINTCRRSRNMLNRSFIHRSDISRVLKPFTFADGEISRYRKYNGPAASCREQLLKKALKAKDFYSGKGIVGLHGYFKEELETLKNVTINIAITGSSGTGKSSFINAIRNLTADDNGAAEVGVVETTMEPKRFVLSYRNNLQLWDLPGVGTVRVPKDSYLKKVNFEKYDFVIITSKCRITEDEVCLAQELNSMKKRLAFVRTHIDNDVENGGREFQRREDVIKSIRSNCEVELQKAELPLIPVFFIDNFEKNAYPDFARLEQYMLIQCNLHKKEMLLSCISDLARDVIESKKKHLKTRISSICDEIASIDSYAEQNSHLRNELNDFKSYLFLQIPTLKIDAMYTNVSDEDWHHVLTILDQDPPEIIQLVDALTSSTRGIPLYGKYKIRKACRLFFTSALEQFAKTSVTTSETMIRGMKILQD